MTLQKPTPPAFDPVPMTLTRIVVEAPGIKSFFLDYEKTRFNYRPGQLARLYIETGQEQPLFHPFSIASSPTEDFLLFTTQIRPESPYKQSLEKLKPGDRLFVRGPVGKFFLPEDPSTDVLLLGSGIGITPFRSIIKFATDKRLPQKLTLLYSNNTPDDIVYRREWEELEKQNPHLKVVHIIAQPEASREKWNGRVGGINEALIREHLKDPNKTMFYVCGTPSMVADTTNSLRNMGIDAGRMMVETFPGYT